jgi:hypothetical protein
MKATDLYYIAGLMDGEGSIMLTRAGKRKHRSPTISITMTTREILEYVQETLGGHISTITKRKEHWKQSWVWSAQYNMAYEAIKILAPYLREPEKKRRAELILRDYKRLTPRNGKYTTQLLEERQAFETEFFGPPSTVAQT